MISRRVGVRSVWRRAKGGGISMAHWSSRIWATTSFCVRSARMNTSASVIANLPLLAPDDDGSGHPVVEALLVGVPGDPQEAQAADRAGNHEAQEAQTRPPNPDGLEGRVVRDPDAAQPHSDR